MLIIKEYELIKDRDNTSLCVKESNDGLSPCSFKLSSDKGTLLSGSYNRDRESEENSMLTQQPGKKKKEPRISNNSGRTPSKSRNGGGMVMSDNNSPVNNFTLLNNLQTKNVSLKSTNEERLEEALVNLVTFIFAVEFKRTKNHLFRKVFHEVYSKPPDLFDLDGEQTNTKSSKRSPPKRKGKKPNKNLSLKSVLRDTNTKKRVFFDPQGDDIPEEIQLEEKALIENQELIEELESEHRIDKEKLSISFQEDQSELENLLIDIVGSQKMDKRDSSKNGSGGVYFGEGSSFVDNDEHSKEKSKMFEVIKPETNDFRSASKNPYLTKYGKAGKSSPSYHTDMQEGHTEIEYKRQVSGMIDGTSSAQGGGLKIPEQDTLQLPTSRYQKNTSICLNSEVNGSKSLEDNDKYERIRGPSSKLAEKSSSKSKKLHFDMQNLEKGLKKSSKDKRKDLYNSVKEIGNKHLNSREKLSKLASNHQSEFNIKNARKNMNQSTNFSKCFTPRKSTHFSNRELKDSSYLVRSKIESSKKTKSTEKKTSYSTIFLSKRHEVIEEKDPPRRNFAVSQIYEEVINEGRVKSKTTLDSQYIYNMKQIAEHEGEDSINEYNKTIQDIDLDKGSTKQKGTGLSGLYLAIRTREDVKGKSRFSHQEIAQGKKYLGLDKKANVREETEVRNEVANPQTDRGDITKRTEVTNFNSDRKAKTINLYTSTSTKFTKKSKRANVDIEKGNLKDSSPVKEYKKQNTKFFENTPLGICLKSNETQGQQYKGVKSPSKKKTLNSLGVSLTDFKPQKKAEPHKSAKAGTPKSSFAPRLTSTFNPYKAVQSITNETLPNMEVGHTFEQLFGQTEEGLTVPNRHSFYRSSSHVEESPTNHEFNPRQSGNKPLQKMFDKIMMIKK